MKTSLGKFLRDIRENSLTSQKDMAKKLGVSSSMLSNIENGRKTLKKEHLSKIYEEFSFDHEAFEIILAKCRGYIDITGISDDGLKILFIQINNIKKRGL